MGFSMTRPQLPSITDVRTAVRLTTGKSLPQLLRYPPPCYGALPAWQELLPARSGFTDTRAAVHARKSSSFCVLTDSHTGREPFPPIAEPVHLCVMQHGKTHKVLIQRQVVCALPLSSADLHHILMRRHRENIVLPGVSGFFFVFSLLLNVFLHDLFTDMPHAGDEISPAPQ